MKSGIKCNKGVSDPSPEPQSLPWINGREIRIVKCLLDLDTPTPKNRMAGLCAGHALYRGCRCKHGRDRTPAQDQRDRKAEWAPNRRNISVNTAGFYARPFCNL
jgi:hypothetical protein